MKSVKITTYVPLTHSDAVRKALGDAGAGLIGEYSYCSFTSLGHGRFVPSGSAAPYIGKPGEPEVVEEERIEVTCERAKAKAVVAALRGAHPYEEVAFDICPLISEEDL